MGALVTILRSQIAFLTAAEQLAICIPVGIVAYVIAELLLDRKRFLPLLRQIIARGRSV